ncbi:MAG TPA: pirin family protein [Steroidobacteraceae bacterium]|nr:pirin family protein [Steroidobacteraceae bacterium]
MKQIAALLDPPPGHWVGDGFPVRSLFTYNGDAARFSPFLLLDFAGPADFPPAARPRGVGQHPHRGFETVTIVLDGELAHRDSTGNGGVIGKGDVQWMTAGAGILHEEFHSPAFTQSGGRLKAVQLWVNLPAKSKMASPGYQAILASDIPEVPLPAGGGSLRVIAGTHGGSSGPARTFTPMNVWDIRMEKGSNSFQLPAGWNTLLVVLEGTIQANGSAIAREAQVVALERAGETVQIEAAGAARVLLLAGEPIDEPVVGYGPFVMNSRQEIMQAIEDFNSGRFGQMTAQG